MPLYEYRCNQCLAEFEELRPMDARHDADCKCGCRASLIPSAVNWSFGWRLTDSSLYEVDDYSPDQVEKNI